jgi:hypothetical protein
MPADPLRCLAGAAVLEPGQFQSLDGLVGKLSKEPVATLVRQLAADGSLETFVETGTYRGETTAFAASLFQRVVTLEIRQDFQDEAKANCREFSNIEFVLGDSANKLDAVVEALEGPALFWLDAHSGGGYFGADDYRPVLAELAGITKSTFENVVIIDDARAFLTPPPPPFVADA